MFLVIILILVGVIGIYYGLVKENRDLLIASATGLILLGVLLLIYTYVYSQNPY